MAERSIIGLRYGMLGYMGHNFIRFPLGYEATVAFLAHPNANVVESDGISFTVDLAFSEVQ